MAKKNLQRIGSLFHKFHNILPLLCLAEIDGGVVLSDVIVLCAYVRGEGTWKFGQRVG